MNIKIQLITTLMVMITCLGKSPGLYGQETVPTSLVYSGSQKTFTISNLPELAEFATAKADENNQKNLARWGTLLWEFGNGEYRLEHNKKQHYSYSTSYRFRTPPCFAPQVYLTPHYSQNVPKRVVLDMNAHVGVLQKSDQCDLPPGGPSDILDGRDYIDIVSNAGDRIVPNHEARVIVHYKAPENMTASEGEGYLVLFFNRIQQGKSSEVAMQGGVKNLQHRHHQDNIFSARRLNRSLQAILPEIQDENARS